MAPGFRSVPLEGSQEGDPPRPLPIRHSPVGQGVPEVDGRVPGEVHALSLRLGHGLHVVVHPSQEVVEHSAHDPEGLAGGVGAPVVPPVGLAPVDHPVPPVSVDLGLHPVLLDLLEPGGPFPLGVEEEEGDILRGPGEIGVVQGMIGESDGLRTSVPPKSVSKAIQRPSGLKDGASARPPRSVIRVGSPPAVGTVQRS
jgi:hypothetical protein